MRIDPKEKIAEVSILEVRKLLKGVDNESDWGKNYVISLLKLSPQKASRLIQELVRRGYIERGEIYTREQFWRKTLKGSTLGLASAAKSVTRKTANRIYFEFMERVKQVNNDPCFLMKVKKVVVFGSYLGDAPKLNDIDIAVELDWKEDHPRFVGKERPQAVLDYAHEAQKKGKHFKYLTNRTSASVVHLLQADSWTILYDKMPLSFLIVSVHSEIIQKQISRRIWSAPIITHKLILYPFQFGPMKSWGQVSASLLLVNKKS